MKAKEIKRILALSVAFTLATPVSALAAAPESQKELREKQIIEESIQESQEPETEELQEPETPETEEPQEPETPETEEPQEPETPETEEPQEPETPETEEPKEPEAPETEEPQEPETPETEEPQEPETPVTEEPQEPETPVTEEPQEPETPEAEEPQEPETPVTEEPQEPEMAMQQSYEIPVFVRDFRFWTVARKYAFAKWDISVKEEMSEDARNIGNLKTQGLCYILQEEENGWVYVESGKVRGFIKAEEVFTGTEAQEILEAYQKAAREKAEEEKTEYTGIESVASVAEELVSWKENAAFLYTRSTVNRTVVDKEYAVTNASLLNVREDKGTDSRIVGTLPNNSLCYILADKDEDWIYIESGDVRGFVSKEYLQYGEEVTNHVESVGEDNFTKADQKILPEENAACYYTLTSVQSGVPEGEMRNSVLEFAAQFIGNPYVWGGTSLTDGADCSGFVQSIYREYGYELPRVAEDQAQYGTKLAVEDARPGDLIFYARDGYIYHVVIYAGEGKTIEAMGTEYGIVQGDVNYENAVWATRVLDDTQMVYGSGDIAEVNATPEMYGELLGNFKLTYYCSCEICCDVETGITATGTPVIEGKTIAVDPDVIPYGTQVIINGHVFTAEDCGGAIQDKRIDIYVNDHDRANALGVNYADVYLTR